MYRTGHTDIAINLAVVPILHNITLLILNVIFYRKSKSIGGKWDFGWRPFRSQVVPCAFASASCALKQFVVRSDGPAYAEMIVAISVPLSMALQYYLNDIRVGPFVFLSGICNFQAYILVAVQCDAKDSVFWGLFSALFNSSFVSVFKVTTQDQQYSMVRSMPVSLQQSTSYSIHHVISMLQRPSSVGLCRPKSLRSAPMTHQFTGQFKRVAAGFDDLFRIDPWGGLSHIQLRCYPFVLATQKPSDFQDAVLLPVPHSTVHAQMFVNPYYQFKKTKEIDDQSK